MLRRRLFYLILVAMSGVVLVLALVLIEVGRTIGKEVIVSPSGRYSLLLLHDQYLGRTETLAVISRPNSGYEREIFRRIGDQPFAFLRWRRDGEAVLNLGVEDEPWVREEVLRCVSDHCRLEP